VRKLFVIATFLLCATAAQAQLVGEGVLRKVPSSGSSYTGPGDVVSGAAAWWGLRAYNGTYAASLGKIANVCTPSDVTCADVKANASGNFNLAGTPSLTCNNSTSICTIKTFYDQIGGGCTGAVACDLVQATIASRAVLTINAVASLPCATFSGSASYSVMNTFAASSAAPNTWSSVGEHTDSSRGDFLENNNDNMFNYWPSTNTFGMYGGTELDATAADSSFHSLTTIFNGASSKNVPDGSATSGNAGASSITTGGSPSIGFAGGGTNKFVFCEGGLWTGVSFNAGQLTSMSSNQHTYWGF
jgi:hypothetical protein